MVFVPRIRLALCKRSRSSLGATCVRGCHHFKHASSTLLSWKAGNTWKHAKSLKNPKDKIIIQQITSIPKVFLPKVPKRARRGFLPANSAIFRILAGNPI